ncbi:hypothetical protein [Saccharothrix sp. HUAS TT1]|uniref:hypothetical protein n=1 Tax=unclassified Saccharothrix TaxID=2593673 RepID=UPI00345BF1AB
MNTPQHPQQNPQDPQHQHNWQQQQQQPHQQQPPHQYQQQGFGQTGPQPGFPPPGYPPQGPAQTGPGQQGQQVRQGPQFQQGQPGYHPYGPQPPKKNRTGLVVGIVIAVVVLAVGGVGATFLLDYLDEPGGGPGEQPIAECDLSADLRSQAHVSSFRLIEKPPEGEGLKRWNCQWNQTEGKDGRDPRNLSFYIYDFSRLHADPERNVEQAENSYDEFKSFANGLAGKPVDGLGDEAMLIIEPTPRDSIDVKLIAREDKVVWNITYSGRDNGFFGDSAMPLADAEAVVRKTAEELVAKQ